MLSHEKNNFLIIRLSSFGDVLLTTCVVRELKHYHPNCSISFIIKKAFLPMIENNKYIDSIVLYEDSSEFITSLKQKKYNCLIDLQNNQRSWKLGKKLKILCTNTRKIV